MFQIVIISNIISFQNALTVMVICKKHSRKLTVFSICTCTRLLQLLSWFWYSSVCFRRKCFLFTILNGKNLVLKQRVNERCVSGAAGSERDSRVVKATHIGTSRQRARCLLASPCAVSWQSAGPDVTVVVPGLEKKKQKKTVSQEMDLLDRGKDKGFVVSPKNIVSSAKEKNCNFSYIYLEKHIPQARPFH